MKVYCTETGRLSANAYFITDGLSRNAVCIDCGEDINAVRAAEEKYGFKVTAVLLTHGHFDHAGAAKDLQDGGAKIYISEKDFGKLQNDLNLGKYMGYTMKKLTPDFTFKDGDELIFGDLKIKAVETAGHTSGSASFIAEDALFTGDTLFCGSWGRTDLGDGNFNDLISSVKKLFSLKGDYKIFPGHGERTTLQRERESNPISEFL